MTCQEFDRLIDAAAAQVREVTDSEMLTVVTHMRECPECRQKVFEVGMAFASTLSPGELAEMTRESDEVYQRQISDPELAESLRHLRQTPIRRR